VALAGAFVCLRTSRTWARAAVRATLVAVCALGAVAVGGRAGEAGAGADSWVAVQAAARQLTPCDATILTPAEPGGFRVHSERSVYGEWRDGTQQFFSPAFSHVWWDRMRALQPGLTMDADGRVLNRGAALADLTAPEIAGIAEAAAARFVVLPADAEALRRLPVVYTNADWALAGATPAPEVPSAAAAAAGGTQSVIRAAGERFMRDVVDPNIRRYRQAEVVVSVVAADGRPLKRAAYVIRQTRQAFGFGCSLDNFVTPPAQSRDFKAPLVDPEQLARFKEVFNYSIIAYAGKWDAIEPVEGSPQFENLDRYVAWCATNGIGLQYHFVSGYPPNWMKWKSAAQRQALFLAHAQRLVARYGDRIGEWQVVNEKHLLAEAPEVIRWFRSARPDLKLGLADCARFFAGRDAVDMPDAETNLLRGMREVRWLRDQGAGVDFFGFHGHRPFGLWADPAAMYKAFDDCARDGVRLWVTEFGAPSEGPLTGQVRSGQWTPALQAEYYTRFFTICFSHPAVDGVNLWGIGPRTWIRHAALLDDTFQPKPAYHALKRLVREKWMTRLAGRLPLDGRVAFRGFCGTYEIEVTPTDGAAASLGCFNVQTGQTQTVQWVWRPGTNALERAAAQ
jgi:GH35 family endo-1,4-beta-xylanase